MNIFEKIRQQVDLDSYTSSPFYGAWFMLPEDFVLKDFMLYINAGRQQCLVIGNIYIPKKKDVQKSYRISKKVFKRYVKPVLSLPLTTYGQYEHLSSADWKKIDNF